ncbi:MAG TPA: outer membrane beta-barrel protein [Cyclobacteriaceae bacterium]|nr:outer membrane beta-barrel protein [Cyclobacteriaceae bacterium]
MVSRSVLLFSFILAGIAGFSQDSTALKTTAAPAKKKTFRPDIPGSIMVELGINFKNGVVPPDFKVGFWGSRTLNIYYQYPIRLFKSNFSINPGLGLSLERWKLTNEYTLAPKPLADGTYPLVPATDVLPGVEIKRSQLINNYLEMPIELRFDTNPEDIARSVNVSVGGRIGWLYDSFTKLDYSETSENKSLKEKQLHGMNTYRYGMYGRVGVGGFSIFCYYNISPMFQDGKGPIQTQMNSVTLGISVNGF